MARIFKSLEVISFEPNFEWVDSIEKCADMINLPHEDYPQRVDDTIELIDDGEFWITHSGPLFELFDIPALENLNKEMGFEGRLRTSNVRVGLHVPPDFSLVPKYMQQLYDYWNSEGWFETVDDVIDWYADFETIHPFSDGNGRVGGIIVAVVSHKLQPSLGFLAPKQ